MSRGPSLDYERIMILVGEGHSNGEVAAIVGCSERSVIRVKRQHGVEPTRKRRHSMTEEERVRAEELLADGASVREVERTLGYCVGSLSRIFPGRGWTGTASGQFARFLHTMELQEKSQARARGPLMRKAG